MESAATKRELLLQNNPQRRESPLKQCNIQLPIDLVDELKVESHHLTDHRRRGFSDLLAICARYGWEAYQRGELAIDRQAMSIAYRLIRSDSQRSCS